jgi:ABC-type lipoprotein release transport system permease subunit
LVAALSAPLLAGAVGLPVAFDGRVLFAILLGSIAFAGLGSLYPVIRGVRLSPVDAMRST